jgi:pimeloyl-ACP methyl ester carboxylesterase
MSSTSSAGLEVGLNIRTLLTASALIASGFILRGITSSGKEPNIIVSPRETLLPRLSKAEVAQLPYPPDALPGARDIISPYGTIRAYEWGPEDGDKVLLVHGISTPCLALGSVAHGLVAKGHRVMLFDLFGRGYSDTPTDLDHDTRLFSTQILLVLSSSSLSWTGQSSDRFALIGYSLGAGISAAFASYFPELLNSLTLIAPSGLIRPHNLGRMSRLLYSTGVIPEPILHRAVKRRLKTPLFAKKPIPDPSNISTQDAVQAEINLESNDNVVLSKSHPNITVESAVRHQVDHHDGFVTAFMSSIRHGPIIEQHENWRRIGRELTEQNKNSSPGGSGLKNGKVLIILGRNDAIINTNELVPDATEVLEGNVEFQYIESGHEAPIKHGDVVVEYIMQFWGQD